MDWAELSICLVGPYLPRPGGVSVQTELHLQFLRAAGATVHRVDTNIPRLRRLPFIGPILIPFVQPFVLLFRLLLALPGSQIVHVHTASYWGFMPAVVAVPLARLTRKRVIVTYHGSKAEQFFGRYGWLVRPIFHHVDTLIVLSQWTQEMLQRMGIPSKQLPILIDTDRFDYRERSETPPVILWAKGLSQRTNPAMAIQAIVQVQREEPEVSLWLAGDGHQLAEMRQLAQQVGARVEFLGNISFFEIHQLYHQAGIFWNTSYLDNMPDNVLEAAACGLPVIATRVGGVPLIVSHGENGLLVDIDDDEALAQRTLDVLRDPDLARRLGKSARANTERFAWQAIGPRLAEIYTGKYHKVSKH